ncbi:response regulator [Polaribacter sp. Z014]|uniref:response regulator n=1 Tax=unclassified Polaribacter TaxID=196858 RepID=UPI00193B9C28|nr:MULTISPECIES: response regulator [unclassified Polaribacter]MCL7764146.1 response regulator [Polaribacter sp. Z014]QVY65240.1 response regulator [Polaribacter sp. Q13]
MKSLSILLIDDDELERIKFKKVCKDICFSCTIVEAVDGKQALHFLSAKGKTFDIIILDLHMPKMNGLELLRILKSNTEYKNIPVVIMSNSEDSTELQDCYNLGISGYFTKPAQYSQYSEKVKSLLDYWKRNELNE